MSVLNKTEIVRRLRLARDNDESLVISPILDGAQVDHDSVDVRLATYFVGFKRTQLPVLDVTSKEIASDILDYQRRIHVPLGGELTVHPGSMVLGSTLEYLSVPFDLSCAVLTRSTWGRLGLIIATAVWVHPLFAGCLTLEILNHGSIPISLSPGARIAQLVFHETLRDEKRKVPRRAPKYACLTRPWHADLTGERADVRRARRVGKIWHGESRRAQDEKG